MNRIKKTKMIGINELKLKITYIADIGIHSSQFMSSQRKKIMKEYIMVDVFLINETNFQQIDFFEIPLEGHEENDLKKATNVILSKISPYINFEEGRIHWSAIYLTLIEVCECGED